MSSDWYEKQLARKLMAACICQQLGNKSIDYTMKRYVDENKEVDQLWIDLAKHAQQVLEQKS